MPEPIILLVEDEPLVLLVAQTHWKREASRSFQFNSRHKRSASSTVKALNCRASSRTFGYLQALTAGRLRHARELRTDLPVVYTTADSAIEWPVQGVPNSVIVQKPNAGAQLPTAISTLMMAVDTSRTS